MPQNTKPDSFEVEIRGPLTDSDFDRIESLMVKRGKSLGTFARYLIDYSTEGIEDRKKDVRLRITNGQPEIIAKTGEWAGSHRREVALQLERDQFDSAVSLMELLGFNRGIGCTRIMHKYLIDGVELALQEVPGHSKFFEAEIVVENESAVVEAHDRILTLLSDLSLRAFAKDEWYDYVKKLNVEANEVFDASKYDSATFRSRLPMQFGK